MKRFVTTFFVIIGSFNLLSAQSESGEDWNELIYNSMIQANNSVVRNFAAVNQQHHDNEVEIYQDQLGFENNAVVVSQSGVRHKGYISQKGSGLDTRIEQYHSSNEANVWSNGENIHVKVKQEGEANTINSYIENNGDHSRTAEFLQKGDKNKIDVALVGDGFQGHDDQWIRINQYGNGHQAEAFIEPFSAPVEVIQTPGAGGEGMSISISNSAFSFPMK